MPSAVLDTSVLVRYLTHDDAAKAASAGAYLQAASEASLLLPDVAVAELAFVLLRIYRWPVADVANGVRAVVNYRAIQVPGRELWLDVADDLESGRGPIDAYLLRTAERAGVPAVVTFDESMRPLVGVKCIPLQS
jgi:predicted nucleic acid-binding protein